MNCPVCLDTITSDPAPLIYDCGHSICQECWDIETEQQKLKCSTCKTDSKFRPNLAYRQLVGEGFCTECRFPIDGELLVASSNPQALKCTNCSEEPAIKKNFAVLEFFEQNETAKVCEDERCPKGVFIKSLKVGCHCEGFEEMRKESKLVDLKSLSDPWKKMLEDQKTLVDRAFKKQQKVFETFKGSEGLAAKVLEEIRPIAEFWNSMLNLLEGFNQGMQFHSISAAEEEALEELIKKFDGGQLEEGQLPDVNSFRTVLYGNRILSRKILSLEDPIGKNFAEDSKIEFRNLLKVKSGLANFEPKLESLDELRQILEIVESKIESFDEMFDSLHPINFYNYRDYPFKGIRQALIEFEV